MSEKSFVHLASGEGAARIVADALASLGRRDAVLHSVDGIAEGPLTDVDSGGANRVLWWERVLGRPLSAEDAIKLDERPMWERVRSHGGDVVVWHGPIHVDRLLLMRAAWHLLANPQRLFEVALSPPEGTPAPLYGAVSLTNPRVLASRWGLLRPVAEVEKLAHRWTALRDQPIDRLRRLEGENLVDDAITAYDVDLISAATPSWTPSARVIGHILARRALSYSFLAWRLRNLLHDGALQGRGNLDDSGVPVELRGHP